MENVSVEEAKSVVKRERSLEKVIKYVSLVVKGLDPKWNGERVRLELDKIFGAYAGLKIVIPVKDQNSDLVGHAYLNFKDRETGKLACGRTTAGGPLVVTISCFARWYV